MSTHDREMAPAPGFVQNLAGQLELAYEELETTAEELRQQNEELLAAQQAVEAERRRYQDLFDLAPDAYLVTDLQGTIHEANRAAGQLLGADPARLAGAPLAIYLADEDRPDLIQHLVRLAAGGEPPEAWQACFRPYPGREFLASVRVQAAGAVHDKTSPASLRWLIRDVTEQQQAQDEMARLLATNQVQRQFMERLIEAAPLGIAVIRGPEHRFELTNTQFRLLTGTTDAAVLGRTVAEVFPETQAAGRLRLYDQTYQTGQTVHLPEYRATPGTPRENSYWDVHLVPLTDAQGRVEGVVTLLHDVTAPVQARQRIVELAAAFQNQAHEMDVVFESMVEGVVVYDAQGRPARANRAARDAYGPALEGRNRPEIVRRLNLRHPDGRVISLDESPVDRALHGETIVGAPLLFRSAQGEDRFMVASAAPLPGGGAVVVWHDVTDERRIKAQREAALQAQAEGEAKLRALFEILPVGVSVLDGQGNVTVQNPALGTILHLPETGVRDGQWRARCYVRPDGSELPADEFPSRRVAREQQPVHSVEIGVVKEDGQTIWVNVSAAPLPFDDWRIITATIDVTEHVATKEALARQNMELQELTRELDAFAHTVAHDLKQPLSAILGCTDLLGEEIEDMTGTSQVPELAAKLLDTVTHNTHKMGEIVESLLLLASTRSQDVEIESVDMGAVVAGALRGLEPLAEARGAALSLPPSWPATRGYGPWVERVWSNYVSNALKYGGQPPAVELGFCHLPAGAAGQALRPAVARACARPGGQLLFWVWDNGEGLTSDEQACLFQPFGRLARHAKQGHGLGLAIVQRIVERLGGSTGVESAPGEGTAFWFTLPGERATTDLESSG